MTWADVAGKKQPKKKTPQALQKTSLRLQVSDNAMAKICEMERRTLVLRKVPPSTTTISILRDLKEQFTRPLGQVVEAVSREPLDRRRFYVRFHTVELKRECAKQGFEIGDIKIPPQLSDVQGHIPDVPHYLDRQDLVSFLSRYGDVVKGDFDKFEETDIRCGVFRFEMNLHPNSKLPGTVHINSDSFTILCKDDMLQCAYCDKYGHRAVHCLKKKEDLTKKTQKELAAQMSNYLPPATATPAPHQVSSASIHSTTSSLTPTQVMISKANPSVGQVQRVQNTTAVSTTNTAHSAVAFVQSENLKTVSSGHELIMSVVDGEQSPMDSQESDLQSTAELRYPPSFEHLLDDNDDNAISSDDSSPPSKRALREQESISSSIVMKPAYYVKPAEFKQHEIHPYFVADSHFGAFIPPLDQAQTQRMEALQAFEEKQDAPEHEEFHLLRIQQNSHQEWMRKLSTLFKAHANKRWKTHYNDILTREYPDDSNPTLSESEARNVYIECVSLVRADLERTIWFKKFWNELCDHNKLFCRFDIACENA